MTVLSILILGVPLAVAWMMAIEELLATRRPIGLHELRSRLARLFGADLCPAGASAGTVVVEGLRIFAWTSALAAVVFDALNSEHALQGIGLWSVLACAVLEGFRRGLSGTTGPNAMPQPIWIAWLLCGGSMAAVGILFGTFDLTAITAAQARWGLWTAAVQPLGFAACAVAVATVLTDRGKTHLAGYLVRLALAVLGVQLFGGGWHFWGVSAYTTGENVTFAAAVLRSLVFVVKIAVVLGGLILVQRRWLSRIGFDLRVTGNILAAMAGMQLLVALTAEAFLRPNDIVTRSLLSWIVAGGFVAYGVLFHRPRLTQFWKTCAAR